MGELTHFDESGASRMVDVSGKESTLRTARASGRVTMEPETLALVGIAGWPREMCWKSPGWRESWRPSGPES